MTNIDRAARAIQPYEPRNGTPRDVALELAAAGLLKSDLPEANDLDIPVPNGKAWLPCGLIGPSVWTAPGGQNHGAARIRRPHPSRSPILRPRRTRSSPIRKGGRE